MKGQCAAFFIGGSAGSLEVIINILPSLRTDLPFPIIIVLHRKSGLDSMLVDLLSHKTALPVKELEEKEAITAGIIYVAPPNYHVLIEKNGTFSLDASEKVNFSRPSIDVTFESAAEVFGEQAVCLLLSGSNTDGAAGLQMVSQKGGWALVQDPKNATVPFMPENALNHVHVDKVLQVSEMAHFINSLNAKKIAE